MTEAENGKEVFNPNVDIIIGSKNAHDNLVRCLEFVYAQQYDGNIRTTVVDNNSIDASVFLITSQYPQVNLIQNEKDVGLAAAYNQALAETQGRCVLFLSADVELKKDFISRQVEFLRENPELAGAAALLLMPLDDEKGERIDSAGVSLNEKEPVLEQQGREVPKDDPIKWKVFGPAGAAAFWDREALEKIAPNGLPFDEDFNAVYLDLDLAWRARWLGFVFACNPKARAVHNRGEIYRKNRSRHQAMDHMRIRNQQICYRKNLLFYGWSKYGRIIRKTFRRQMWEHWKKFGTIALIDLWIETKRFIFKSRHKKNLLQGRVRMKPESMYSEMKLRS